jgi:hypothetical protein
MSWTKLLASNTVTSLPATKAELDKLRSLVARSLKDVAATGLSTDMRFILAYDAARTLSLMIVRAAGYRPKRSVGTTILFWRLGPQTRYLQRYRPISMAAALSATRRSTISLAA